ncbi:hypothetical protein [Saccharopolyspora spinosa]|uniref:hypothetical protein n=1 Tax=Saccharopolyspora spinosa TaxID=60894 RepID=UPI000237A4B1
MLLETDHQCGAVLRKCRSETQWVEAAECGPAGTAADHDGVGAADREQRAVTARARGDRLRWDVPGQAPDLGMEVAEVRGEFVNPYLSGAPVDPAAQVSGFAGDRRCP